MANVAWPSVRAKIMRITRLDDCGVPASTGTKNQIVTPGLVKVDISAEYEDGTENAPKNGNDDFCWVERNEDKFKYFNLGIQFCDVDPEAYEIVTKNPIWTDAAGDATGIKMGRYARVEGNFALEVWSDIPGSACGPNGKQWGYWLWPFIGPARLDELTLNNEAAEFNLSNAITKDGSGWEDGPYNVELNDAEPPVAAKLNTALTAEDHFVFFRTNVAPPTKTNGAVAIPA
ncbi:major tail protein [Gordonia phage Lilbeanie]|uniref:Major tail protein n=1 Tax=Gordonia phage Lilbeanie TaxID=2794947 RepID=A0A7T1KS82_9CAUD|nr:major tail protein [Gordonia phage Lilbeanie]QPO17099.1 major tail protein [Gordonia phage Lilbeanie]